MNFNDTFDGAAGTKVSSRGGWIARGDTDYYELNGAGGMRALPPVAGQEYYYGVLLQETSSESHFVECVIGADTIPVAVGDSGSLCIVKSTTDMVRDGSLGVGFQLTYASGGPGYGGTLYLRQGGGPIAIASIVDIPAPGSVFRLEAKMALDGQSVQLSAYINGIKRIGPVTDLAYLRNTACGVRASTATLKEDYLRSFSGGSIALPPPDTTKPVLTLPTIAVTGPTTATGGITADEKSLSYAAVTTSATKPTPEAVMAGAGFAATHFGAVDAGTNAGIYHFTGLAAGTQHWMHVTSRDETGNLALVVTSAPFTTQQLGAKGSDITTGGATGAQGASFLLDKVGGGEANTYFHYVLTRTPPFGQLETTPLGGFTYSGPADSFDYRLYKDGVDSGLYRVELDFSDAADVTPPNLPGPITVLSKTHNAITVQCPEATDDIGVVWYEWSKDGGATWEESGRTHTFSTLAASTAYPLRARAADASGKKSTPVLALSVTTDVAPVEADTTAPVLSAASASETVKGTAKASVTTTEAGPAWAVLTASATAPTVAAVKAGIGLHAAQALLVLGSNADAFTFSGLAEGLTLHAHIVQDDVAAQPNTSTVVTSPGFTTETTVVNPSETRRCIVTFTADGTTPLGALGGISWAWWDTPTPEIGSAALIKGVGATLSSGGVFDVALPGSTLALNGIGCLEAVINDGTVLSATNRALKKPVRVS